MTAPERIHNWQHSQLSIARHWGMINYNGHRYVIAHNEAGSPLVREDVLRREAKEAREAARDSELQGDLLGDIAP